MNNKKITQFYSQFLKESDLAKYVGWMQPHSQELNFLELSKIIKTKKQTVFILDAGCGTGELAKYLVGKFPEKHFVYYGIDLMKEYIDKANEKKFSGNVELYFEQQDFMKFEEELKSDYVFASGVFSVNQGEKHLEYVIEGLQKLYSICELGMAVNFLSDNSPSKNRGNDLVFYRPDLIAGIASKTFRRFTIDHQYRDDSFVLYVNKNEGEICRDLDINDIEKSMSWLLKAGMNKKLIDEYAHSNKLNTANTYALLGVAYLGANNLKKAEEKLFTALSMDKSNVFSLIHIGYLLWTKCDFKNAMIYFEEANKINPSDSDTQMCIKILKEKLQSQVSN